MPTESRYIPAGPRKNVTDYRPLKESTQNHIWMMHEKWLANGNPRGHLGTPPQLDSISSIKRKLGCHRKVARRIKEGQLEHQRQQGSQGSNA